MGTHTNIANNSAWGEGKVRHVRIGKSDGLIKHRDRSCHSGLVA